jgi:hypothetical protein
MAWVKLKKVHGHPLSYAHAVAVDRLAQGPGHRAQEGGAGDRRTETEQTRGNRDDGIHKNDKNDFKSATGYTLTDKQTSLGVCP